MSTMLPRISVIVAVKNEQTYVHSATTSILGQTGVDLDVVVVDDGSTDTTLDILNAIRSPNLRVVRNQNPGKARAYNLGVSLANGDWLCLFAGDDIMPEGSLRARWEAVSSVQSHRPVVGLSRLIQISDTPSQNGVVVPKNPRKGGYTGSSYLMSRRAAEALFPVNESLPNEDTWLEIGAQHLDFEIVHSGVIGNNWRVHAGNSVNMLVPFNVFNDKITRRMKALSFFKAQHEHSLLPESLDRLNSRIVCEQARSSGSMTGVLLSQAPLLEKLRALSTTNAAMYEVRRRLYRLLSGW